MCVSGFLKIICVCVCVVAGWWCLWVHFQPQWALNVTHLLCLTRWKRYIAPYSPFVYLEIMSRAIVCVTGASQCDSLELSLRNFFWMSQLLFCPFTIIHQGTRKYHSSQQWLWEKTLFYQNAFCRLSFSNIFHADDSFSCEKCRKSA